jgi:hypothetical protein
MPHVRKLSDDEVRDIENKGKGQRKLVEEEYDRYLAEYDVGDYGEADLGPEENRLTVRNRFKAAARRRGVALEFRRTSDTMLRFKVVSVNNGGQVAAPSVSSENGRAKATIVETAAPAPEAPAKKRRGGRPRKSA